MAKFLFIYRESTESRAKPSPEEMQALQAAWYTWMQKFSSAIVPGGDGLKHTGDGDPRIGRLRMREPRFRSIV